jgi:hypothetical protein
MNLDGNEEEEPDGDEFLKSLHALRQIIIPEWDPGRGFISK